MKCIKFGSGLKSLVVGKQKKLKQKINFVNNHMMDQYEEQISQGILE